MSRNHADFGSFDKHPRGPCLRNTANRRILGNRKTAAQRILRMVVDLLWTQRNESMKKQLSSEWIEQVTVDNHAPGLPHTLFAGAAGNHEDWNFREIRYRLEVV